MKLITEQSDSVRCLIEAKKDGTKNYIIEGVFLQAELKNRNGRIYPKAIMEREVNRYIKEHINTNRAVGELGHPDSPTINYPLVSHKILSLKNEGNNYIGRAKILDTPNGRIVKTLMDEGVSFGVSSRGMGSLKTVQEAQVVQEDYHLATAADIVSDPSAPDAFVRGIMEKKEWAWNNGIIVESEVAEMETTINNAKEADIEAVSLSIFKKFISRL